MKTLRAAPFLLLACTHAAPAPQAARASIAAAPPPPVVTAQQLSADAHALLRREGELLWQRWTSGTGALPASAVAEHPLLTRRDSLDVLDAAKTPAAMLLRQRLALLQIAREAGADTDALERARAQLAFTPPEGTPVSERELDRLLTDEPNAQKRAGIALAEAKAAAPLAPLVIARDAAVDKAISTLGLGTWAALEEGAVGMPLADLAALAEQTLAATEQVAAKAVAATSVRNIGVPADRLRRSDLPRLVRSAAADPQFPAGRAWPTAGEVLKGIGVDGSAVKVDAEPSPSKGARPLALLVDPPADVRLSLRPVGGFEEQRATLHEAARAAGATLIAATPWEVAQLGEGSAPEAVAQLFEELSGDPAWLREVTQLRGEPLDDLVHTQAARRLLTARRAAALVLFEIGRHQSAQPAEEQAALYRGLVQRATLSVLSDEDAARWAVEAEPWIRSAPLLGAILAAQLESEQWWKSPQAGVALRKVWAGGRSMTALDAARALGMAGLDPSALAASAARQLAYSAPDAPPPAQKPDYKYMQGDKKRRHRRRHK